ncbi:unnamed protein product [Arabidopsis thaliana]|uniref:Transmembrane protein n=1 Tax=Arabidopsis thaliana TaxID=3702 RepID=A0A654EIE2_ARATH|nr:unnamed protein product [Arabidopsis thaliana]
MPPRSVPQAKMQRIQNVYLALHVLLINAIVISLVFTAIAAGRDDNETISESNSNNSTTAAPPPHRNMPDRISKFLDEISLWIGVVSLVVLLLLTTTVFTIYIAVPSVILAIVGRFIFGRPCFLEFGYITFLQISKWICYLWLLIVLGCAKLRRNLFTGTSEESRMLLTDRVTKSGNAKDSSLVKWNKRIAAARARATAESDRVAKEKADIEADEDAAETAEVKLGMMVAPVNA